MSPASCPQGISIRDDDGEQYLDDTTWTVLRNGIFYTLTLTVARGVLRRATKRDKSTEAA